ncbi:MAG: hypothetical protein FD125_1577 [bacterium]|nr:MAG: hypothetical protein FD125_1577 [bacterium]
MNKPKPSRLADTNRGRPSPVVIDGRFLRDTARDAVIQFFVPLTAVFAAKASREQKGRLGG